MRRSLPAARRGAALLLTIFIAALFSLLTAWSVKMVYNYSAGVHAALAREQALFLAEAGLEKGKVELARNPNWYTDPPYYLEDNTAWLINLAAGQTVGLGEGSFKLVREKGLNRLYAVGHKGKSVVVLKLEFTNPPFSRLAWSEL